MATKEQQRQDVVYDSQGNPIPVGENVIKLPKNPEEGFNLGVATKPIQVIDSAIEGTASVLEPFINLGLYPFLDEALKDNTDYFDKPFQSDKIPSVSNLGNLFSGKVEPIKTVGETTKGANVTNFLVGDNIKYAGLGKLVGANDPIKNLRDQAIDIGKPKKALGFSSLSKTLGNIAGLENLNRQLITNEKLQDKKLLREKRGFANSPITAPLYLTQALGAGIGNFASGAKPGQTIYQDPAKYVSKFTNAYTGYNVPSYLLDYALGRAGGELAHNVLSSQLTKDLIANTIHGVANTAIGKATGKAVIGTLSQVDASYKNILDQVNQKVYKAVGNKELTWDDLLSSAKTGYNQLTQAMKYVEQEIFNQESELAAKEANNALTKKAISKTYGVDFDLLGKFMKDSGLSLFDALKRLYPKQSLSIQEILNHTEGPIAVLKGKLDYNKKFIDRFKGLAQELKDLHQNLKGKKAVENLIDVLPEDTYATLSDTVKEVLAKGPEQAFKNLLQEEEAQAIANAVKAQIEDDVIKVADELAKAEGLGALHRQITGESKKMVLDLERWGSSLVEAAYLKGGELKRKYFQNAVSSADALKRSVRLGDKAAKSLLGQMYLSKAIQKEWSSRFLTDPSGYQLGNRMDDLGYLAGTTKSRVGYTIQRFTSLDSLEKDWAKYADNPEELRQQVVKGIDEYYNKSIANAKAKGDANEVKIQGQIKRELIQETNDLFYGRVSESTKAELKDKGVLSPEVFEERNITYYGEKSPTAGKNRQQKVVKQVTALPELPNSVNVFRKQIDDIPNEYKDLYLSSMDKMKNPALIGKKDALEAGAKYVALKNELVKQGYSESQIKTWDIALDKVSRLSPNARKDLTRLDNRITKRDFELFRDIAKAHEEIRIADGVEKQDKLPGYVQQIVNSDAIKHNDLKTKFQEANPEKMVTLLQDLANEANNDPSFFPKTINANFFKRRTGNLDALQDLRTAVEARIEGSARVQGFRPLRDEIGRVVTHPDTNPFTKDVATNLAKRMYGYDYDMFYSGTDAQEIYGAIERPFRALAGQFLATTHFAELNALQSSILFAEAPEAILPVAQVLSQSKNWTNIFKAFKNTGLIGDDDIGEFISSLTGTDVRTVYPNTRKWIEKADNAIPGTTHAYEVLSRHSEAAANLFADFNAKLRSSGGKAYTKASAITSFIMQNPFVTGTEGFNKVLMTVAHLSRKFNNDPAKIERFIEHLANGTAKDANARTKFNLASIQALDEYGFVGLSDLNRTSVARIPGIGLATTFTTFPGRLVSKLWEWAHTNPQALVNYLSFTTLAGGPRTLALLGGPLNAVTAGASKLLSDNPVVFNATNSAAVLEAEAKFDEGKYKGYPTYLGYGISNLRKAGGFLQDKVLGARHTLGTASLSTDISIDFPLNAWKTVTQMAKTKEGQSALLLLGVGSSINSKFGNLTPYLGKGFITHYREQKRTKGASAFSDNPVLSLSGEEREAGEGIKSYDKITNESITYPNNLFRKTGNQRVEEVLANEGQSRLREQLGQYTPAIIELKRHYRKKLAIENAIDSGANPKKYKAEYQRTVDEFRMARERVLYGMRKNPKLDPIQIGVFLEKVLDGVEINAKKNQSQFIKSKLGSRLLDIPNMRVRERVADKILYNLGEKNPDLNTTSIKRALKEKGIIE